MDVDDLRRLQWDLNHANPEVFCALFGIMGRLANRGIGEVLRLDAAPFIWKRLGTDCENQPEVHDLLVAFRALLAVAAPATVLKAEAIVAPDQLVAYLARATPERVEGASWPTTTSSWSCSGAAWPLGRLGS